MLSSLVWWNDEQERDGFQNMAVDEWLSGAAAIPVLRTYRWQPGWGSFGYFIPEATLPEWPVRWVRRLTGGGIVDHRSDMTYTLWIPRGHGLAEARGAASYREIHSAVASFLQSCGCTAALSPHTDSPAGGECFSRPVEHDVLSASGQKLAGAGQKRTASGLLHQGSINLGREKTDMQLLALSLAETVSTASFEVPEESLSALIREKYGNPSWQHRR